MSTAQEHQDEAERLMAHANRLSLAGHDAAQALAKAQIHATLALAAATREASDDAYRGYVAANRSLTRAVAEGVAKGAAEGARAGRRKS